MDLPLKEDYPSVWETLSFHQQKSNLIEEANTQVDGISVIIIWD